MPALSGTSHETACSGNAKPHSDVGRVCTLVEAVREHISEVVAMTNGLIAGEGGAAEALGVPPSTLRNRMKKLGVKSQAGIRLPRRKALDDSSEKLDDSKPQFESGCVA